MDDPSDLTERQAAIYRYLIRCVEETGRQPSYREIAEAFGIRYPAGVMCHLVALEKKGYLIRPGDRYGVAFRKVRFVAVDVEIGAPIGGAAKGEEVRPS